MKREGIVTGADTSLPTPESVDRRGWGLGGGPVTSLQLTMVQDPRDRRPIAL